MAAGSRIKPPLAKTLEQNLLSELVIRRLIKSLGHRYASRCQRARNYLTSLSRQRELAIPLGVRCGRRL